MPNPIDDARQLIESRLAEIDSETRRLERAVVSLGEGSARKRRPHKRTDAATLAPTKPKRRATRKRKAAKRTARGQRREELLAAIKANPGSRPADLAKAIGIKSTQVHALIAKAKAEKLIVRHRKGYALKG